MSNELSADDIEYLITYAMSKMLPNAELPNCEVVHQKKKGKKILRKFLISVQEKS